MNSSNTPPRRDALSLRVSPVLNKKLKARAAENHRSVMAEAEILLEREVFIEEAIGEGLRAEMHNIMYAFEGAGRFAAHLQQRPELAVGEAWLADPACFRRAMWGAVIAMWKSAAMRHGREVNLAVQTEWLAQLETKFREDDAFRQAGAAPEQLP